MNTLSHLAILIAQDSAAAADTSTNEKTAAITMFTLLAATLLTFFAIVAIIAVIRMMRRSVAPADIKQSVGSDSSPSPWEESGNRMNTPEEPNQGND